MTKSKRSHQTQLRWTTTAATTGAGRTGATTAGVSETAGAATAATGAGWYTGCGITGAL